MGLGIMASTTQQLWLGMSHFATMEIELMPYDTVFCSSRKY